jgi:hypothetical protein
VAGHGGGVQPQPGAPTLSLCPCVATTHEIAPVPSVCPALPYLGWLVRRSWEATDISTVLGYSPLLPPTVPETGEMGAAAAAGDSRLPLILTSARMGAGVAAPARNDLQIRDCGGACWECKHANCLGSLGRRWLASALLLLPIEIAPKMQLRFPACLLQAAERLSICQPVAGAAGCACLQLCSLHASPEGHAWLHIELRP